MYQKRETDMKNEKNRKIDDILSKLKVNNESKNKNSKNNKSKQQSKQNLDQETNSINHSEFTHDINESVQFEDIQIKDAQLNQNLNCSIDDPDIQDTNWIDVYKQAETKSLYTSKSQLTVNTN